MNCSEIRESMPGLAVGLEEPSPATLQHLETCAPCATHLQELRQTLALLDEWKAPEPSPYFDTRLQARLREEKDAESAPASRGWFAWLPRPALAIAVAFLVAVGVGVVSLKHATVTGTPDSVAINRPSASGANGSSGAQRGTAVADLQTLDSDDDLYANFDVLDDIDSHQDQATSDN